MGVTKSFTEWKSTILYQCIPSAIRSGILCSQVAGKLHLRSFHLSTILFVSVLSWNSLKASCQVITVRARLLCAPPHTYPIVEEYKRRLGWVKDRHPAHFPGFTSPKAQPCVQSFFHELFTRLLTSYHHVIFKSLCYKPFYPLSVVHTLPKKSDVSLRDLKESNSGI